MPNTHLREASRILFGDADWFESNGHGVELHGDTRFRRPGEGTFVTLNELIAELKAAAND